MSKEELVVQKLIDKGYHISCAESCTGGMLTSRIVNVPNASLVLDASVVTYANEAKIKYLNVNPATIDSYGVVSEQTAGEMARGIASANGAQVGVGISGIAGPTGGTSDKPVGMVCFGICICEKTLTFTMQFGNIGRYAVREKSVEFVFDKLTELL
ncbi:MAG: CinA family protein [Coprococcus sp.]